MLFIYRIFIGPIVCNIAHLFEALLGYQDIVTVSVLAPLSHLLRAPTEQCTSVSSSPRSRILGSRDRTILDGIVEPTSDKHFDKGPIFTKVALSCLKVSARTTANSLREALSHSSKSSIMHTVSFDPRSMTVALKTPHRGWKHLVISIIPLDILQEKCWSRLG